VTGVQTCALPIFLRAGLLRAREVAGPHAAAARVVVVEVSVARREAQPLLELVVAQHVEAEPVAVLADALRHVDRAADGARAHVLLAAVDELAGDQQTAGGLTGRAAVDDPARIGVVAGLLRPPEAADAEVEDAVARDGREADA